jgi:hypothetical protein
VLPSASLVAAPSDPLALWQQAAGARRAGAARRRAPPTADQSVEQ